MSGFSKKFMISLFMLLTSIGQGQVQKQNRAEIESPDRVYMLTYDHGGLILWGSNHFLERLQNATDWLDRYPNFKIGLDNESHIYDYFAENEPEILNEIRGYLNKYTGRFDIGSSTYGQPLSHFINEESNIRQISYALKSNLKHFGDRPYVYLMSEHAMHSQIPQILNGFGFKGAIMRTHFMMYGYNPTFNVPIGWWVGLDGSRIPTVPTYEGEGSEFGKTTVDNWILTRYPGPECDEPMESYRERFAHIQPLLASRADDSGLRREGLVSQYEPNPQYSWILLDELLTVLPEPTVDMVTVPNDFTVRMPWGYCGNEIWNMSRQATVQVLVAERLAALELMTGGLNREKELHRSWQNLLVGQHHDVEIVGLLPEARKFLPASLDLSRQVQDASLEYFAVHMKGEGFAQVTVFNPLSWHRDQWIVIDLAFMALKKGDAQAFAVRNAGKVLPTVVLSAHRYSDGSILDGRIAFKADLPALSLSSFSVIAAEPSPAPSTEVIINEENLKITTPHLDVILDPEGGFKSITDKHTGNSLLKSDKRAAFFAGRIDGVDCESHGKWIITKTNADTPWAIATEYGFIGTIPYTFEVTFYRDTPQMDCRVEFNFNGQKIGQLSENQREDRSPFIHEHKLRFKFFPNVDDHAIGIRDLPFAISETPNRYVEGNYWTAIADNRTGMAVFNRGTMGSVREGDGGFSVPLAYAMYYIWGTRMLNGKYTYEFSLYPFIGAWQEADLHRQALAYNFPVLYASGETGDGRLGSFMNILDIDNDDILVSALYSEDGEIYARMHESKGQGTRTSVSCKINNAKLMETNLIGEDIAPISKRLAFKPWQIRTIRIEKKP